LGKDEEMRREDPTEEWRMKNSMTSDILVNASACEH
jgi:hypothetical protein